MRDAVDAALMDINSFEKLVASESTAPIMLIAPTAVRTRGNLSSSYVSSGGDGGSERVSRCVMLSPHLESCHIPGTAEESLGYRTHRRGIGLWIGDSYARPPCAPGSIGE